ncbi:SDR family oxidoreductase [Primorskyibacter sp. S87]|uniref:SDR family oxidoreductase n=1 Tax=Primorskyibacter sp. S87 TaxID=3415126 RepID=UPI003C7E5E05
MAKTLFSFGHGYTATALSNQLKASGWRVIGTARTSDRANALKQAGVEPVLWPEEVPDFSNVSHLLVSIAPDASGDPVLNELRDQIELLAPRLQWAGYLSTTAVYGDHAGGWVDENTPLTPASRRGAQRIEAESAWRQVPNLPIHIFRLAGIYGPGRGPFAKIRNGNARRIIKPGQVFSRIHVDDIAQVLMASMANPRPGAAYNVCDDDPAPPQDVIGLAAELLDLPLPAEIPFDEAGMTDLARSFYGENKRVRNDLIKKELGVKLRYPSYREGLRALLKSEDASRKRQPNV